MKIKMNLQWSAPSGHKPSRRMQVNVPESGVVKPGSYSVETRGNVIYWPLKGENK